MRQMNPNFSFVENIDELYESAKLLSSININQNSILIAPLKSRARAMEKAHDDYSKCIPGPGVPGSLAIRYRESFY